MKLQYSPWGRIDDKTQLAEGIISVGTPSHGGIKLDQRRNAQMPTIFRVQGGWYEEDCEWAKVYVVFRETLALSEKQFQEAKAVVGQWFPDAYETYFGEVLAPGQSVIKDRREHINQHWEDWLVTCAWGSWHERCPKGKVLVRAIQGKYHVPGFGIVSEERTRYFLVDEARYNMKNLCLPFVIGHEDEEVPSIEETTKRTA